MPKFKNGYDLPSTIMLGYLAERKLADADQLSQLALFLTLREELNWPHEQLMTAFRPDLSLLSQIDLPQVLDVVKVSIWRRVGFEILKGAVLKWLEAETKGAWGSEKWGQRLERQTYASRTASCEEAFKKKLVREEMVLETAIEKTLFTT